MSVLPIIDGNLEHGVVLIQDAVEKAEKDKQSLQFPLQSQVDRP